MTRENYGNGSIVERGPDRWMISIALPPDPLTGTRRRSRFTYNGKKRDAQRALREALTKRDTGGTVIAGKETVADRLTSWLSNHTADGALGLRTQERYEGIIRQHLIPELGAVRLQQLTADHISAAKTKWLSGKESTAKRPLSGASVNKIMVVLHEALADAVNTRAIAYNPIDAVKSPSAQSATERRALSADEIVILLKAAGTGRFATPIRFALATGVRQGELLGASWDAFDAEAGTFTVSRSLIYVKGQTSMTTGKTANARRVIELSEGTVAMLRAHRTAQLEHRLKCGALWKENGLIFPSSIGTPWLARLFYRGYRAIVDRAADVELARPALAYPATVTFHSLRHTAASQWIKHGVDIYTVSRRLGHAKPGFTMLVYGHLLPGQQRVAASALDHLLMAEG
jgi:integrase